MFRSDSGEQRLQTVSSTPLPSSRPRSPSNVAVTNREFLREEDVGGEVSPIGLPSEVQGRGGVSGAAAVAILLFASEAADRERDREHGERQAWTRHDSRLDPETQSRFQRLEHPEQPEHLSQTIQNRQSLMGKLKILRSADQGLTCSSFGVFVFLFMGALAALTLGMLAVAMVSPQRNRARESGSPDHRPRLWPSDLYLDPIFIHFDQVHRALTEPCNRPIVERGWRAALESEGCSTGRLISRAVSRMRRNMSSGARPSSSTCAGADAHEVLRAV